jgi:hypothetical protein
MPRIYYAVDYDTDNRATVSGIQAFSSFEQRDEFVNSIKPRRAISSTVADTACLKMHECTAHEAHQRGFI